MHKVLESLNQFEDAQFFELFEGKEDKEEKVDEGSEDGASQAEVDKEADSIINKANKNWNSFLTAAKGSDDDIITPFFKNLKVINQGGQKGYDLYDSPYKLRAQKAGEKAKLIIIKNANPIYDESVSPEVYNKFCDFLQNVIKSGASLQKSAKAAAEKAEIERKRRARKDKLKGFLSEDMNTAEYYDMYSHGVMEELQNMGYTSEEASFILGEAIQEGMIENLADERVDLKNAAKAIAQITLSKLSESELNESAGADLAISIGGMISTFILAGGIAKLVEALNKSKNPKVQKFAKMLAKASTVASKSILGGTTSMKESEEAPTTEQLNEAASFMVLVPYVASAIGVFVGAYGIHKIMEVLNNSKNPKVKAFGQALGKIAGGASKAGSSHLGESKVEESKVEETKPVEINEAAGADLAISIGGMISTFVLAGGIAKLVEALNKSKNPKVQKFAKMLAKASTVASKSILGGTTSMKEGLVSTSVDDYTKEHEQDVVNEADASFLTLIPYVASTIGIFVGAYGIHKIMEVLNNSKNPKVKAFAQALSKVAGGASKAGSSHLTK